jgi:DNA-binding PadR family transcriptional regulator
MKELLEHLNKAFESKARLGIHLKALEEGQYVEVQKQFVGRKPNTTYRATDAGRKAFADHLKALEKLISGYR